MNKQTEALKIAQDLAYSLMQSQNIPRAVEVYYACKEALEQSAKEPVGYFTCETNAGTVEWNQTDKEYKHAIPLFTHPAPSWQKLSDDEIRAIDDVTLGDYYVEELATKFARAIEQELRSKNART